MSEATATEKLAQWAAAKELVEVNRRTFLEKEQEFKLNAMKEKHELEMSLMEKKAELEMDLLKEEHRVRLEILYSKKH